MDKLYLVTRQDLPHGQQAIQACHAMTEFLVEHAKRGAAWHAESNTLALLSVPNEEVLLRLASKASRRGFQLSMFREPDRGNELTAIALEPLAKPLVRQLPLALTQL